MLLRVALFAGMAMPAIQLKTGQYGWAIATALLLLLAIVLERKIFGGDTGE